MPAIVDELSNMLSILNQTQSYVVGNGLRVMIICIYRRMILTVTHTHLLLLFLQMPVCFFVQNVNLMRYGIRLINRFHREAFL